MMKFFCSIAAALCLSCFTPIALADDVSEPIPAFKEAFEKIKFISEEKPNPKAKYYIYLTTGPFCAGCQQQIAATCKSYDEMKASGEVELIMLSHNATPEQSLAFRDNNGGTFPVMMFEEGARLPGMKLGPVIPHACVVNNKGELIIELAARGIIPKWRKYTIESGK